MRAEARDRKDIPVGITGAGTIAGLTAAERRVAERIAKGRRNAEIAADLALSTRTVEWHLSNLYRKFGVRSRTELALRVAVVRGTRARANRR